MTDAQHAKTTVVAPEATTEAQPMMQENSITWELIAESSKNETTAVHSMIIKRFQDLDAPHRDDTNNITMQSSYLSYPPNDLQELFDLVKLRRILRHFDIPPAPKTDTPTNTKKKSKKTQKPSSRELIKLQQIKKLATQSKPFFDKKDRTKLREDFHNRVMEVVVLYYMHVAHYSFKDKVLQTFIDATFSLRDALQCFSTTLHPTLHYYAHQFLDNIKPQFPWKSFLQSYTQVLIRTHFKKHFQKALKPFKEQEALVQAVHKEPHNLYILPWGVGTGKTAMLPPLSHFYHERGHQTLYCVPFGPVRDQSAALLYRCGIPFAYVVRTSGAYKEQFELQPSFHCSDGKEPQVLIVDPDFVRYYMLYWQEFELTVDTFDVREQPPDVYLPTGKKRYSHLSHLMWNDQFALVLDEPCEEDDNVHWVLNNLPETSFVMSATSWNLVDDTVQQLYTQRTSKQPQTIEATTIGVSTTLVGYWLANDPVLSPFHGVKTKMEFVQKYDYVSNKVLWKRFLSANVLLDWASRIGKVLEGHTLSIAFDIEHVTFDSICERVLQYCRLFIDNNDLGDEFYATFFAFGSPKTMRGDSMSTEFIHMLTTNSAMYMGGCIVGTPTVKSTYERMQPLLSDFPTLDEMQHKIDAHRKAICAMYNDVQKIPVTKRGDLERKRDKIREIEGKRNSSLPIPESIILNTPEYIQRYRQKLPKSNKPLPYLRVQQLEERGDPSKGLDDWRMELDVMEGSFWRTNEEALKWRWKGVGSIMDHKEFNMKNINDLEKGYVGFMLLDKLGAQGLNLKIRHGILMRGEDGSMLPASTCLQVAGRVGRWGQDDTGFVYLTEEELFWRVFG